MERYDKPFPNPSEDSEIYWNGCKEHKFLIQKCKDCGAYNFPPGFCKNCMSMNSEWVEASGKGRVFSWVIFHQAFHKAFKNDIPYAVAEIQLEEGPLILSNLVNCKPEEIKEGMEVEVVFDDADDGFALPKFRVVT